MKSIHYIFLAILLLVGLVAAYTFGAQDEPDAQVDSRWYTTSQLKIGKRVFENNCASCHDLKGQGLAEDWREPLADGSYSPPPLDGTAHVQHHPMSLLKRTINIGGKPIGGKMPSFKLKLQDDEKTAVIAYFQNWWSDTVYDAWIQRDGLLN